MSNAWEQFKEESEKRRLNTWFIVCRVRLSFSGERSGYVKVEDEVCLDVSGPEEAETIVAWMQRQYGPVAGAKDHAFLVPLRLMRPNEVIKEY